MKVIARGIYSIIIGNRERFTGKTKECIDKWEMYGNQFFNDDRFSLELNEEYQEHVRKTI